MKESEIHPHVPEEKADLFTAMDSSGSTEFEYMMLVSTLVRATKPTTVLETGSGHGVTTGSIGRAIALNKNHGHLWSVEHDEKLARLAQAGVAGLPVTVLKEDSLEFIARTPDKFDFAFLDSDLSIRAQELEALLDKKKLSSHAIVCIHDTSRLRTWDGAPDPNTQVFWERITALTVLDEIRYIEFPLSRGLVLLQIVI